MHRQDIKKKMTYPWRHWYEGWAVSTIIQMQNNDGYQNGEYA